MHGDYHGLPVGTTQHLDSDRLSPPAAPPLCPTACGLCGWGESQHLVLEGLMWTPQTQGHLCGWDLSIAPIQGWIRLKDKLPEVLEQSCPSQPVFSSWEYLFLLLHHKVCEGYMRWPMMLESPLVLQAQDFEPSLSEIQSSCVLILLAFFSSRNESSL